MEKIFISCVSSQFKECREAIASDLRANDCQVFTQEDFKQGPRTLIEWLQEYIARCDCVIVLVGDAFGFKVPEAGIPATNWPRSYTQWEYFLASGERLDGSKTDPKDCYVYFASESFLTAHSVSQSSESAALQRRFCDEILESGKCRSTFDTVDALGRAVLRDLGLVSSSAEVLDKMTIQRILNTQEQKDDLWNAINLYCSRIPEEERYDPGEFQELIQRHISGDFGPHRPSQFWKAYCLVAKVVVEIVGMLLAYEDTNAGFCFISYIATKKPRQGKTNPRDIGRRLLEELLGMVKTSNAPGKQVIVLAEIDHPNLTRDTRERQKRLARIKLFEQAGANLGVPLRCVDFHYVQPQLDPTKNEVPMLLLYMAEIPPIALSRAQLTPVFSWLYAQLYSPDIFQDPSESEKYGAYLNTLLAGVLGRLPESVKLLRARQL